MRKYINTLLKGFILLQVLVLNSCNLLYEDMSDCDLFLEFKYDYNMAYEDWFAQQVKEVNVFIFDTEGLFVEDFTATVLTSDYRMPIPYKYKGYNAVVWAGRTKPDYQLIKPTVEEDMKKLFLQYNPQNNISSHQIAALWHSGPHRLTFPEDGGTQQTIPLIRNTNDLHIALRQNNATSQPMSNFDITIKGANGSYNYKNEFPQGISTITYLPVEDSPQDSANIYTMRFGKDSSLIFSAKEKASGKNILIEGNSEVNLIEFVLKGKPDNMTEQEYLDRRYIWDITLNYKTESDSYIAVSILINGWTYWFQNTDL